MSKQAQAKHDVLNALREAGAPMTAQDLAQQTGHSRQAVGKALEGLVNDKRVAKGDKDEQGRSPYSAVQRAHRVTRREPSRKLYKPLRQGTRRALTASMALDGAYVDDVVDALNAQTKGVPVTRNWVIAEYSALAGERGLGFEYVGDYVRLLLPEGVSDPFSPVVADEGQQAEAEPEGEPESEAEPEGEPEAEADEGQQAEQS